MFKQNDKKYNKLVSYIQNNQNTLYRLAYSYVKNKQIALDIVQESIYKALKNVDKLKQSKYMKTWLYRIIVNTSISYIRKNRDILITDDMIEIHGDNDEDIAQKMDLYDAIDKLDEKHKTVVILRYFKDMKFDDISKLIQCNINTVKTRLYSATDKLKVIMGSDG
ncbi:MAG: sigma-70 family RNA polymerase sigma factor [Firmicutes bacterium]|nr:sigma-70 family RNA polymerase sigma factor [Bacillota bacterium]